MYVYLPPSETVHKTDQKTMQDNATKPVQEAYIRSLEEQIACLQRELERKDAILQNLTERIPQLEAPSEPRESPETATETAKEEPQRAQTHSVTGEAEEGVQRRSWWRRMFGG